MSETETHKGTLVPITNLPGTSLEDDAREVCSRLGIERSKYHDSWVECLEFEAPRYVYFRDGVFYEVRDTEVDPPDDFIEATKNPDGSYDYFVSYYNGGAGFDEIMDAVIKKADKGD